MEKIINTKEFTASTGEHDNDEFAYIYCVDESGYCLSLARWPDDELVEVMVIDQVNYKTREVTVELSRKQLQVCLSPVAAAHLDQITKYKVPLTMDEDELQELDAALTVLFEGDSRGLYVKRL